MHPEVVSVIELLSLMTTTLSESGLEICAQVCSNILYGLQNCSVSESSVQKILGVLSTTIKQMIETYSQSDASGGGESFISTNFNDILLVYQALSIVLNVIPDLNNLNTLNFKAACKN